MPTTIKDAIKMFEERKQVVAIEQEKVSCCGEQVEEGGRASGGTPVVLQLCNTKGSVLQEGQDKFLHAGMQVELHGTCPSIDKMDATLSTLKACK